MLKTKPRCSSHPFWSCAWSCKWVEVGLRVAEPTLSVDLHPPLSTVMGPLTACAASSDWL